MKNLFDLTGKVALLTGATSGMGKAIAEALGYHGATLIIASNDELACEQVKEEFSLKGIATWAKVCDVSDSAQVKTLVDDTLQITGKIDILVSCVGIGLAGSLENISTQDFLQLMQVNLLQALELTQLVIPSMRENGGGSIIYLSSIASVRGNKSLGLYGITKAGLVQLARNVAVEHGPLNIRANAISPGMIDTPFAKELLSNKEFLEKRLTQTPLRRVGLPDEIAGVAVMLASKAGGFITGQNIIVDGGTTISDGN
ncbi:SDR family NAD(P)-dependent oxidoreductase [Flectobacillus longus]|uniref:SDR family NAD(P)-dependent oxidoreductase n=1 Tax=Flectobacillus longus TaxID=2984207 RepID=UPI0024B837F6|nr:SDR family oxidoreductase [Flectobacillus longus]MDI9881093.1 SDR family oxidoreductase [Flectobacillus longus]